MKFFCTYWDKNNYSGTKNVQIKRVGDFLDEFSFFEAERKLMPEMDMLLQKRMRILQAISLTGPVGRRTIADQLQLTERDIRNETATLQAQQLIAIQQKGMICTDLGYEVLDQLKTLFHELSGLSKKEQQLAQLLSVEKVIIVAGDVEQDPSLFALLGKEASHVLTENAKPKSKVAVTGGSSVASIAPFLTQTKPLNSAHFIAARGGIGDEMSLQANTLVAQFAENCASTYRSLFLPEHLSEQAYQAMKEEPIVKDMMALYNDIDIVIHGIGAAKEMANRRNSSEEDRKLLAEKGAVAEAFGYYFDVQGNIVHRIRTIGIQLEQVKKSSRQIAIAAGEAKVTAIQAYFKNASPQTVLITDERAATEILSYLQ